MKVVVSEDKYSKVGDQKQIHNLFEDLIELMKLPHMKIGMIMCDNEIGRIKKVQEYCKANNIKLVSVKPGVVNTLAVVERSIGKLKDTIIKYLYKYEGFPLSDPSKIYENSVSFINAYVNYLNQSYHSGVGGIPIEIYAGIEGSQRLNVNLVSYPQFKEGQYVLLRPRGKKKSLVFQARSLQPGIVGTISRKDGDTYTVVDRDGTEYYVKWYEFVPIKREEFEKLSRISIF
jgi:hypothetical protein